MKRRASADMSAMIGALFGILIAKQVLSKSEATSLQQVLNKGTTDDLIKWAADMTLKTPTERWLNLEARVQNMEALMIMMATTVQSSAFNPDVKTEVDMYMEAWYQAQTRRGALHLSKDASDGQDVFI